MFSLCDGVVEIAAAAQGNDLPKCSKVYKARMGGPMKPISDQENTSQVNRGMS